MTLLIIMPFAASVWAFVGLDPAKSAEHKRGPLIIKAGQVKFLSAGI